MPRHRRDRKPTKAQPTAADQTPNTPADPDPTEVINPLWTASDDSPTEAVGAHRGSWAEAEEREAAWPNYSAGDDTEVIAARHGLAYDPLEDSGPTRTRRWRRISAYAAGLLLLIGVGVALTYGSGGDQPVTRADDQRASRNQVRATVTPTVTESAVPAEPVPTTTAPAETTTAPTPTTAPTSAAPRTTAPKAAAPRTSAPKASAAPVAAGCSAYSGNRLTACDILPSFGFSTSEMSALSQLWENESGWDETAENSGSGAYGIPQALPGSKMASAGADWRTNPATQIRWGLGYIKERYGSPSAAWSFWQSNNWY
jgi:hypothetical protein